MLRVLSVVGLVLALMLAAALYAAGWLARFVVESARWVGAAVRTGWAEAGEVFR